MTRIYEKSKTIYNDVDLLDHLLSYKIDSTTFIENENLVKKLCDSLDRLKSKNVGFLLFEITVGKSSAIKLIAKSSHDYEVLTWKADSKIEKPINIIIHQEGDDDIQEDVEKIKTDNNQYYVSGLEEHLLAESLTGYCISKKNLKEHCEFLAQDGKSVNVPLNSPKRADQRELFSFIKETIAKSEKEIRAVISDYVSRLDCQKLRCSTSVTGINLNPWMGIAKIEKVKQSGNRRIYQADMVRFHTHTPMNPESDGQVDVNKFIGQKTAGIKHNCVTLKPIGNLAIAEVRDNYSEAVDTALKKIPFEFVDEGRLIAIVHRDRYWNMIIGPDPKTCTDESPIDNMKRILSQYIDTVMKKSLEVDAQIKDAGQIYKIDVYEDAIAKDSRGIKPIPLKMKALKKMIDEYQYIGKKEKAKGKDVTVTDKIKYNHSKGEVAYNDFAFAVDDEMIKNAFMDMFNHYMVEYYRGSLSEEVILNDILKKIFEAIKNRINTYSADNTIINIKLNNAVDVKLEIRTSKNGARLIYINEQRFNKNEVVTVLREMTCYRSQAEADMFIKNVGKLGLSVYIAISTGYEVKFRNKRNAEESSSRIFKFRKNKGRSNYSLILDTVEIKIVGKTLINTLYSKFVGEYVYNFNDKVPSIIMKSVESSLDYAKYKFLIDSTYEAFQKNSRDFLAKKVKDVEGKFCKYYNSKNRKLLDAIEVTGTSKNHYVVCYDSTSSWVFLNPEVKDENTFKEGKYVCMVDQSNIKSNIGYDTVIAKLMALRNDSVIAGTIYNLKEELNG